MLENSLAGGRSSFGKDDNLPFGWKACESRSRPGVTCYLNKRTGKRQFVRPLEPDFEALRIARLGENPSNTRRMPSMLGEDIGIRPHPDASSEFKADRSNLIKPNIGIAKKSEGSHSLNSGDDEYDNKDKNIGVHVGGHPSNLRLRDGIVERLDYVQSKRQRSVSTTSLAISKKLEDISMISSADASVAALRDFTPGELVSMNSKGKDDIQDKIAAIEPAINGIEASCTVPGNKLSIDSTQKLTDAPQNYREITASLKSMATKSLAKSPITASDVYSKSNSASISIRVSRGAVEEAPESRSKVSMVGDSLAQLKSKKSLTNAKNMEADDVTRAGRAENSIVRGQIISQKACLSNSRYTTTFGLYEAISIPKQGLNLRLGHCVSYYCHGSSTRPAAQNLGLIVEINTPLEDADSFDGSYLKLHKLYGSHEVGGEHSATGLYLTDKVTDVVHLNQVLDIVSVAFTIKARRTCTYHCYGLYSKGKISSSDVRNFAKNLKTPASSLIFEMMGLPIPASDHSTDSMVQRSRSARSTGNFGDLKSTSKSTQISHNDPRNACAPFRRNELHMFKFMDASTWTPATVDWNM